ncbi:MAG: cyclic nucleotide-binding domain-containing protein, partial [Actinobacteria bacterium]|nr:cyclic nucleotide-binding domain-containing protein [Actinomycetota bacterium]
MTAMTPAALSKRFPGLGSSLGSGELESLLDALELHDAAAGEALVAEGTSTDALFLVWEGQLDVMQRGRGGDRRLAQLGPGSYFGEVSLLDPGPAGASVVTEQGCVALRLSRPQLDKLRTSHPEVAASLLADVVQSLRAKLNAAAALVGGLPPAAEPVTPGADELSVGSRLARDFRDVSRRVREQEAPTVVAEAVAKEYDVVVIGAGPHALAYAIWLVQDRPETRVALVEKRRAPGFKIGESTLGPVVRAAMSMGVPLPVLRRLFNNKLGLHFWWMGEDSDELHMQVDHVVEETFQLERRVWETMMLRVARRAGIDVYQDTKVLIEESRTEGQPKELVCVSSGGDVLRLQAKIVCDASGPAAVIGRHLGIRRKYTEFNTNAYFAYFTKKADVDLPTWDVAATRHLCFPEGWVWFIELASWERASDENLTAMVDHLLDIGSPDESAYPTRFELAETFDCPLDQWPISIGVVPRTDVDSAADLPLEERFQHYVNRYPVFKQIMDTYELIEQPYEGLPSYISYLDLTQHSDRYAGDGWLLLGDAGFFVNPLYSPGMTYGHSMASFAARETVSALERGDFSEQAFAAYDAGARGMFSALVSECEMWYRSFRHVDAYERGLMLRVAFFIGLAHQRIAQLGGIHAMRRMVPIRPMGPPAEPILHPRYNELLRRLIDAMRAVETRNGDPEETARVVKAIIDPLIEEIAAAEGVAALRLGDAMQYYD